MAGLPRGAADWERRRGPASAPEAGPPPVPSYLPDRGLPARRVAAYVDVDERPVGAVVAVDASAAGQLRVAALDAVHGAQDDAGVLGVAAAVAVQAVHVV